MAENAALADVLRWVSDVDTAQAIPVDTLPALVTAYMTREHKLPVDGEAVSLVPLGKLLWVILPDDYPGKAVILGMGEALIDSKAGLQKLIAAKIGHA